MGWLNRHKPDASQNDGGAAQRPPPLPYPFQALSDFAFRPARQTAAPAPVVSTGRGFARRVFCKLPFKYRLLIVAPLLTGTVALASLLTMMVYYTVTFPHPLSMRNKERAPVIRILARDGSVLAERGAAADYMPLDLLPRHVQGAVIATEDRRFLEHYGLDPVGLLRAFFANLRAGRFAQGGSTLTQQLAKNLFLTPDRTLARKIEELGLALWLELRLSKADILELYLNRVYFGGGAYGIEAASQRYFDKSAREMTIAEAAVIAGLLKAPSKYSPASSPGAARARSRVVLAKMLEAGVIGVEDERKALEERIVFYEPKTQKDTSGIEYAIDFVLERLPPLLGGGHAEVVVETTLDATLQRRANEIVRKAIEQVCSPAN
jgi:penicillin-binding protein 1A